MKQNKQTLDGALAALSDEMKYTTGGWHFANISKIKNCCLHFQSSDTKVFIFKIVQLLRRNDTSYNTKFKLAQLLNLLKAYNVSGFNENVLLFQNQITSSYYYMQDSPLSESSKLIIENLWKTQKPIKPIVTRIPGRFKRIKTSTPSANSIRSLSMNNETSETIIKHSTPPPFIID